MGVKIIHGANDGVFEVAGAKVETVRASLVDAFNIPADALAFVTGEQVERTYRLHPDDTLEFVKQKGKKGRYPGGKTKLAKQIIPLLLPHLREGIEYREPFFGWGAIGLRLLHTRKLTSIWINDKHPGVAAYWTSVIQYPDALIEVVQSFVPTRAAFDSFKRNMLSQVTQPVPTTRNTLVLLGFQKLALHRMSFSGLGEMAGGPMSDILSRWKPNAIRNKIRRDHQALSRVKIHGDCCTCLDFEEMRTGDNNLLYLDPPYYLKGPECYPLAFEDQDHLRLAGLLRNSTSPWLLSYDDCPEIRALYPWAVVEPIPVRYSINGAILKNELLIRPK